MDSARPIPLSVPVTATETARFAGLWEQARGQDFIPDRAHFTPRLMAPILPSIFIFDYKAPDQVVYRLAGTRVVEAFGFDPKGMNVFEMVAPKDRPIRRARWECAHQQPCGMLMTGRVRIKAGYMVTIESLILPVLVAKGAPELQFFGVSQETGPRQLVWTDMPISPDVVTELAEQFSFVDIGFGVPGPVAVMP